MTTETAEYPWWTAQITTTSGDDAGTIGATAGEMACLPAFQLGKMVRMAEVNRLDLVGAARGQLAQHATRLADVAQ